MCRLPSADARVGTQRFPQWRLERSDKLGKSGLATHIGPTRRVMVILYPPKPTENPKPVNTSLILAAIVLLVALNAVVITLLLSTLKKARRVDLATWELREWFDDRLKNEFHQLAALAVTHRELGLEEGLPGKRTWAAPPDFLLALARKALSKKPEVVDECNSGVSMVVSAQETVRQWRQEFNGLYVESIPAERKIAVIRRDHE